jgi:hypothetical protein
MGWYLMMPPMHPIDDQAPLTKWITTETFSTEFDCERERAEGVDPNGKVGRGIIVRYAFESLASAQCVSPDDPRLEEK